MSHAALYQAVRQYLAGAPSNAIRHAVTPDERFNLPLVSLRVYGSFAHTLAVMAAAGLSSNSGELTERVLILPDLQALLRLYRATDFVL